VGKPANGRGAERERVWKRMMENNDFSPFYCNLFFTHDLNKPDEWESTKGKSEFIKKVNKQ
jgi:hypothetical protein